MPPIKAINTWVVIVAGILGVVGTIGSYVYNGGKARGEAGLEAAKTTIEQQRNSNADTEKRLNFKLSDANAKIVDLTETIKNLRDEIAQKDGVIVSLRATSASASAAQIRFSTTNGFVVVGADDEVRVGEALNLQLMLISSPSAVLLVNGTQKGVRANSISKWVGADGSNCTINVKEVRQKPGEVELSADCIP